MFAKLVTLQPMTFLVCHQLSLWHSKKKYVDKPPTSTALTLGSGSFADDIRPSSSSFGPNGSTNKSSPLVFHIFSLRRPRVSYARLFHAVLHLQKPFPLIFWSLWLPNWQAFLATPHAPSNPSAPLHPQKELWNAWIQIPFQTLHAAAASFKLGRGSYPKTTTCKHRLSCFKHLRQRG